MNALMTHQAMITLVTAISGGTILMAVSRWIGIPAIVLLLASGALCGPQAIGLIHADSLGPALPALLSIAVAMVLMEAGLTLDIRGYETAPHVIRRLLTVGIMITWIGTAAAIHFVLHRGIYLSILSASLVIVTGPTVIMPLLKRIKIQLRVHSILHWEGVLIDPIGVFLAVLCFEWIGTGSGLNATVGFLGRILIGIIVGGAGGLFSVFMLKRRYIAAEMAGAFTLALGIMAFGIAENLESESGLLATIVFGFVLGFGRPDQLRDIRQFQGELADIMIAVIFMILASRLQVSQFQAFGLTGLLCVGIVMAVIRPLNILASTLGAGLNWREKTFLAWLAPRGIVAASMASLFRIELEGKGIIKDPAFVETFTYSVIICTILIQGLSANRVAILLKLKRPAAVGWLLVGAHRFARSIGEYIKSSGLPVVLVDTNSRDVAAARSAQLDAHLADARNANLLETDAMLGIGNILALTDNEDLNLVVCQRLSDAVGRDHVFSWVSGRSNTDMKASGTAQTVWAGIPKPSMVSAEIEDGTARIVTEELPLDENAPIMHLLAVSHGGKIQLVLDSAAATGIPSEGKILKLWRITDSLDRWLRPESVFILETDTFDKAVEYMVERASELDPIINGPAVTAEIQNREKLHPTNLGNGVAIPHAYIQGLRRPRLFAARVNAILTDPDSIMPPIQMLFLVLSPRNKPQQHLEIMGEIARLVHEPQHRENLFNAQTPEEIWSRLTRPGK